MITENEKFIKIQQILAMSDIHTADCIKINDLIIQLSKENQQSKERIEYLERSNNRKEETIIDLRTEQQLDLYKSVLDEIREYINSNPNVFYDEYLIGVETLKNNECVDETVGEIKFISNLLQILDKVKENE